MGITAIRRDYGVTPSMVRIETTDTLATVSTTGYIAAQAPEIDQLNKGAFQWEVSDAVLVYAVDGVELYEISSDFASLIPISSGITGPYLEKALNLSDVDNTLVSFNNLGLGSGETILINDGDFAAGVYELPVPCPNFVIVTSSSAGLQVKLPIANIDESFLISQGPTIQALSTSGDSIEIIDQNDVPLFVQAPDSRVFYNLTDASTAAGTWGVVPQTVTVNDKSGIVLLDDTDLPVTYAPSNYSPTNAFLDGTLEGIDNALSSAGADDAVYGETYFQNNAIDTVIAGIGVPSVIGGAFSQSGDLFGFTEANGVLTYTDIPIRTVQIDVSLTATMNLSTADLTFTIYKNGAPVTKSAMTVSIDGVTPAPKTVSVNCLLEVANGDTIELYVTNNTNTDNVLVQDLNTKVTAIGGVGVAGNTVVNLATVVDPNVTSYAISTYSNMVNTWSGSPVIGPGELDIGQTVELKVFFNLDPSLIGTQPSLSGNFRFSFGGILTLGDEGFNIILTNNATRNGEITFSVTRIDATTIQANYRGYYTNTSVRMVQYYPVQTPLTYPYNDAVSNTITLEWRPVSGSATEYMTCNLVNTRITKY